MLSCSFRILVVLFAGVLPSAQASLPVAEVEPNNALDQATPTGLADFGVAIISPAEIGNDPAGPGQPYFESHDFFRFTVPTVTSQAPVLVTLAANPTDPRLDLFLRLHDGNDRILMHNEDINYPDNLNPLLQAYVTEPGDYFALVNARIKIPIGADGLPAPEFDLSYDLTITVTPGPANPDSIEPNDTPGDAILVEGNHATFTNQFIGDGPNNRFDIDRYRINLTPPAIIKATIETTNLQLAEPLLSASVPTGPVVNMLEYHESDATSETLEYLVLDDALYNTEFPTEIIIRGASTAPDPGDYSPIGFYNLTIDVTPIDPTPGPFEPNDSANESINIDFDAPATAVYAGTIGDGDFANARGDVDFYRVSLDFPGAQLAVSFQSTNSTAGVVPVATMYDDGLRVLDRQGPSPGNPIRLTYFGGCRINQSYPPAHMRELFISVAGTRDRPTADPTLPFSNDLFPANSSAATTFRVAPSSAVLSLNGGPGSTGQYIIRFEATLDENAPCGNEPDDIISQATEPFIIDDGSHICSAGVLCDGACGPDDYSADLFRIKVTDPPRVLNAFVSHCTAKHLLRLFDDSGNELELATNRFATENDFDIDADGLSTHAVLDEPGDYFVGVSNSRDDAYSAVTECTGFLHQHCDPERFKYSFGMSLSKPAQSPAPVYTTASIAPTTAQGRLFATRLDHCADNIIELDPDTGETINAIPAPHAPFGRNDALAYDGSVLYFMSNATAYPTLYTLNPNNGDILMEVNTWFGSGIYGDMTAHGDKLHVLDLVERTVFSMSNFATLHPRIDFIESTPLDFNLTANPSLFGSIATAIRPFRFLIPGAPDTSLVSVANPETGFVSAPAPLAGECPNDPDVNGDGEIDQADRDIVLACIDDPTPPDCENADLNCDRIVDSADELLIQSITGAAATDELGGLLSNVIQAGQNRATAITTTGPNIIYSADWNLPVLLRFDPATGQNTTLPTDAPLGSLAGQPHALLADFDIDNDVDLLDFQHFQRCFDRHNDLAPSCESFDFDGNNTISLADYTAFQSRVTGAMP